MLGKEISAYLLLRGKPLKSIIQVHAPVVCSQLLSVKCENESGDTKIYLPP
jgi:hypothetical protein